MKQDTERHMLTCQKSHTCSCLRNEGKKGRRKKEDFSAFSGRQKIIFFCLTCGKGKSAFSPMDAGVCPYGNNGEKFFVSLSRTRCSMPGVHMSTEEREAERNSPFWQKKEVRISLHKNGGQPQTTEGKKERGREREKEGIKNQMGTGRGEKRQER